MIEYYKNNPDNEICYFSKIQRTLKVGYEQALSVREDLIKIGLVEKETFKINKEFYANNN